MKWIIMSGIKITVLVFFVQFFSIVYGIENTFVDFYSKFDFGAKSADA